MSLSQAIFNPYQTLAFGSISASFAAVGTPIPLPIYILRIINGTNGDMIFSLDGVTSQIFVPASTSVLYEIATNHNLSQSFALSGDVQFYVKQSTAAASGAVYVESVSPNLEMPSLFA